MGEFAELLLGLFALGQIAGDFTVADQLTGSVTDGGDNHVGPKGGAVLANAPSFVFKTASGSGDGQFLLGQFRFLSLGRIESAKMATDDFLWPIAFDALRSGIPGSHVAFGSEQENSVIRDLIHQETKGGIGRCRETSDLRLGVRGFGGIHGLPQVTYTCGDFTTRKTVALED